MGPVDTRGFAGRHLAGKAGLHNGGHAASCWRRGCNQRIESGLNDGAGAHTRSPRACPAQKNRTARTTISRGSSSGSAQPASAAHRRRRLNHAPRRTWPRQVGILGLEEPPDVLPVLEVVLRAQIEVKAAAKISWLLFGGLVSSARRVGAIEIAQRAGGGSPHPPRIGQARLLGCSLLLCCC